MKRVIKEGNYARIGVQQQKEWTIFTFCGEREDECSIVLKRVQDGQVDKIKVPAEFSKGSLRSAAIRNLDVSDYVYYYEINGKKVLDPCAHAIMGRQRWNDSTRAKDHFEIYDAFAKEDFDWGRDVCPEVSRHEMVMYKLHVRGFTMDSGTKSVPGTFRALTNRIPYLKKLGITTVELMPVYEFEEMYLSPSQETDEFRSWDQKETDLIKPPRENVKQLDSEHEIWPEEKVNYWGYGPGNYFAVKASYASEPDRAAQEYKFFIKHLHENGMECVMEMYFPEETNHNLILDALRYWVLEFHVDGFHLLGENLPLTAIIQDNLLSRTKIFYADTKGLEPKHKNLFVYREEYQYPARKVLNHQNGDMREFVDQQRKQGETLGFVNFITSNNGFTLADLFMYNDKHNRENGEDNRDGCDWNFSNNYGVEGPTRKRYINSLRRLKWRNSIIMLCMAQGVPLLWSGDEMGNSQMGNNNAYCQDNPVGWLNWKNEKTHHWQIQFVRRILSFRKEHPIVANEKPFRFSDYKSLGFPDSSIHGESAWKFGADTRRLCVGMMYCGDYSPDSRKTEDVYIAYNFLSERTALALPKLQMGKSWYLVVDSSDDRMPFLEEPERVEKQTVEVQPQSICILVGRPVEKKPKISTKKRK